MNHPNSTPPSPESSARDPEDILTARGVKPTALRVVILRAMMHAACAVSISDLEARLGTVDKSTIFRTLTLFLAHHLVHTVEDGSGQTKYALCEEHCHCGESLHGDMADLHAHFYCERCRHTYCLRELHIPAVSMPEGFHLHSASLVLKGLCPQCRGKAGAECREWEHTH